MVQCSGVASTLALLLLAVVWDFCQGPAWVGRDTACEVMQQQLGLLGGCVELPRGSTAPPRPAERMWLNRISRAPLLLTLDFLLHMHKGVRC